MKDDYNAERHETPDETLYRCPVCNKIMAGISSPGMTGWLRCYYKHKTIYRAGVPVLTTKNGNTLWQA